MVNNDARSSLSSNGWFSVRKRNTVRRENIS